MKHGSEAEEKVYELEKQVGFIVWALSLSLCVTLLPHYLLHWQVLRLKGEVELQRNKRLQVEARAETADEKVEEFNSKVENVRCDVI